MKQTHDKLYKKYEEPDVLGLRLITKWIIFLYTLIKWLYLMIHDDKILIIQIQRSLSRTFADKI